METVGHRDMTRISRKKSRNQHGAILIIFVIMLAVLLGLCALGIDLGVAYHVTGQEQNVADAAALAGAGAWRDGLDQTAAKNEAIRVAAANSVLNDAQVVNPDTDVVIGSWNAASGTVVPWDETIGAFAIQVTVRRTVGSANGPIPLFFANIWGKKTMDLTRTSVAGLEVRRQPRVPVHLMIVQDGSTSFQEAWSKAITADVDLLKLINGASVSNDATGVVTFNAQLPDSWMKSNRPSYSDQTYYDLYKAYPAMNQGIKYTTDTLGRPLKTDTQGIANANGLVRPMAGSLTALDPSKQDTLPKGLDDMGKLVANGNAWGDTDTAAGLNYAIDQLLSQTCPSAGNVIVLISDGKPHDVRGDYYSALREQTAIAAADRAGAAGIKIHTVTLEGTKGVNYTFNEGLVRNGGVALRAQDANDLEKLLLGIGSIAIGHPRLLK